MSNKDADDDGALLEALKAGDVPCSDVIYLSSAANKPDLQKKIIDAVWESMPESFDAIGHSVLRACIPEVVSHMLTKTTWLQQSAARDPASAGALVCRCLSANLDSSLFLTQAQVHARIDNVTATLRLLLDSGAAVTQRETRHGETRAIINPSNVSGQHRLAVMWAMAEAGIPYPIHEMREEMIRVCQLRSPDDLVLVAIQRALQHDVWRERLLSFRDESCRSLLHIAASRDHLDLAVTLIESGADVLLQDKNGDRPGESGNPERPVAVMLHAARAKALLQRRWAKPVETAGHEVAP